MKKTSAVLPYLLNAEAVTLGSVITSIERPLQRHYDQEDLGISEAAGTLLISPGVDYSDKRQQGADASCRVILQHLLQAKASATNLSGLALETKKVLTYDLRRPDETFDTLCGSEQFRKWITNLKMKKNSQHFYFVVGIQTLIDAKIDINKKKSVGGGATATIPTDAAGLSVQAGAQGQIGKQRVTHFLTEGEQIWGIYYREIKLTSRTVTDPSQLKLSTKQEWESMLQTRDEEGMKLDRATLVDGDSVPGFQSLSLLPGQLHLVPQTILENWPQIQASQQSQHPSQGSAASAATVHGSPLQSPQVGGSGHPSGSSSILSKTPDGGLRRAAGLFCPNPYPKPPRPSANKISHVARRTLQPDGQATLNTTPVSRRGPSVPGIHVDPPIQKAKPRAAPRMIHRADETVESGGPSRVSDVGSGRSDNRADRPVPVRLAPQFRDRSWKAILGRSGWPGPEVNEPTSDEIVSLSRNT